MKVLLHRVVFYRPAGREKILLVIAVQGAGADFDVTKTRIRQIILTFYSIIR